MSTLRKRMEARFEGFGYWIFRNRFKTLLLMLLVVAGFISQLPKTTIDTSTEGFLHDLDPARIGYDAFRKQFGRDEFVLLAIKSDNIFNQKFLRKLEALHRDLEKELPYLDEVTSLVNARNTRGEGNQLIVEDLLENWPQTPEDMQALKERVLSNPLYKNFLISEDGRFTTVMISTTAYATEQSDVDVLAGFDDAAPSAKTDDKVQFLTDAQNSEMVAALRKVVERYQAEDFPIYAAGSPVVVDRLKRAMQHDMQTFTKLTVLTIAVLLFILFRRISGVLLPLVVVIVTLLSTFGAMAATGTPLKLPTQILPSFLLAVGVAASVHLLAMFFRNLQRSGDKVQAMAAALGHSGLAIVMTSLTTAAGLFSFATSQVAPVADLGRFGGLGVLISLMYTLVLLPALMAVVPIRQKETEREERRGAIMDKFLLRIAHISTCYPKPIVAVGLTLLVLALLGTSQIRFYHNPLVWMPPQWDVRVATEQVDNNMKGSTAIEVVIDTGRENGLYEPAVMNKINHLHETIAQLRSGDGYVGKTTSVVDILKESNKALHENRAEFYNVPRTRELIAQELLLFENSGSDDLEDFVDSQFSKARFTIKMPWLDATGIKNMVDLVEQQLNEEFTDNSVSHQVTGIGTLMGRTMDAAIHSTKQSYLIAAVAITLMMIAVLGGVKIGLVSMIPNLLPILLSLGAMAIFGVPLDMFTMLIGSIALGLAVDDTIHILHNFRRYYQNTGDVAEAVRETMLTTGRAITVTSLVLSLGFFIFMAAEMQNVFRFGLITGCTIVSALIADFFLAPALMVLLHRGKQPDRKEALENA